ncbi:hypothetical protein RF11_14147 [Thelohanellus kitauei]|uniref:Uncharacterized protein n=1 Tax=Thelohanellus kitauei TaxID=669202 RepID=A0A0C2M4L8_THEKT|nr:hypothetical protein RF11_14147 [Thelohanellus kitauei]
MSLQAKSLSLSELIRLQNCILLIRHKYNNIANIRERSYIRVSKIKVIVDFFSDQKLQACSTITYLYFLYERTALKIKAYPPISLSYSFVKEINGVIKQERPYH